MFYLNHVIFYIGLLIRNQINNGRDYNNITLELGTDVSISSIQWEPISNFWRKEESSKSFFTGEFDGNGHTIYGLTNDGFSITELQAAFNDSTPEDMNGNKCKEVCFALFGSVKDAYIHDIVIENVNIDLQVVNSENNVFLGDCVAAGLWALGLVATAVDCELEAVGVGVEPNV